MLQFLLAAPTSGSGKTTVARGLMACFASQGLRVQPFKCGPDYIDTKFHTAVCGRPSVNLDTFMATLEHIAKIYATYSHGADVCVVEGMMGLFDGYDRDSGSSAEIARVLGLPVVLVVDARSAAYSMAPLLQGFMAFRPDVHIAGVIFNRVGSERHRAMLQQVCSDIGMRCLGFLPRQKELEQAERYLGLDFSQAVDETSASQPPVPATHLQELFMPIAEQLLQIDGYPTLYAQGATPSPVLGQLAAGRAVVARNAEAFTFIYQETLDALGDNVVFFDPEHDVPHLEGCDLLYLPGGYPEKHLQALVANEAARTAIRQYAEAGGRIIAECGGMMYLCRGIVTDDNNDTTSDGRLWPMCGVLPCTVSARGVDRRLSLGYRQFTLDGRSYRGHEFHYTQFIGDVPPSACQVYNAKGERVGTPVYKYNNVLASYTHLYLNETNIY